MPHDIPILDYDRMAPLENDMDPLESETLDPSIPDDPLFDAFRESLEAARGASAIGFSEILTLILKLLELVGGCPFARAVQSAKEGDPYAMGAYMQAGVDFGLTPREAVRFAIALRDKAKATDEIQLQKFVEASAAFKRSK